MSRPSAPGAGRTVLRGLFARPRPAFPRPAAGARPAGPPPQAFRPSDVPRWATTAARLAAGVTLPSGLWRVALVAGVPKVVPRIDAGAGERTYILGLSLATEGLALATLGLVRPWGEVVPRWVPGLGGRRIPVMVPVVVAGTGSAAVTALCGYAVYQWAVRPPLGTPLQNTVVTVCYAPLLAWGPLLGAVTASYYRRRTRG
ncbi:hypothetical protein [Streptomyces sp. NPDC046887]|uniref:hypothetical protein n=1 Tax=Streptomyces sp. NPDC046887 TaxID=3155472 RepID=UPI003408788F